MPRGAVYASGGVLRQTEPRILHAMTPDGLVRPQGLGRGKGREVATDEVNVHRAGRAVQMTCGMRLSGMQGVFSVKRSKDGPRFSLQSNSLSSSA